MTFWKIHTNEHPYGLYVHGNIGEKAIRKRMYAYIREKLAVGYKLAEVLYCYSRVSTQSLP